MNAAEQAYQRKLIRRAEQVVKSTKGEIEMHRERMQGAEGMLQLREEALAKLKAPPQKIEAKNAAR